MREILFRGKRVDNWEWIEGGYVKYNRKHYIISSPNGVIVDWFEVIPETVGQYTSLKDKNGKRIFEGDIVYIPRLGKAYEVKYQLGQFFVGIRGPIAYEQHDCEVIGNIHDNPEMIGGKEDA